MSTINRTTLAQKYKGKWVALKPDRKTVISAGDSARAVLDFAKSKGVVNPIITHIPKVIRPFCGKIL